MVRYFLSIDELTKNIIHIQDLIYSSKKNHTKHFHSLVSDLVMKFKPVRIICFGKQNFFYERTGCFGAGMENRTHYCLLIITEAKYRIDYEAQDYCNSHFKEGGITLVCHSAEAISEAVETNSRFFLNVLQSGELIYSADGLMYLQPIPEFIPIQAVIKAEKHWNHRMPLAEGFVEGAGLFLGKEQYNLSVFMMHQAIEQCSSLLVRVVMGYRADFHNIHRLLSLCRCFSNEPFELLATGTEQDKRLFEVLVKSYSQSRYSSSFYVDETDAKLLFIRVNQFIELVKKFCLGKISELQHDIELYNCRESEVAGG